MLKTNLQGKLIKPLQSILFENHLNKVNNTLSMFNLIAEADNNTESSPSHIIDVFVAIYYKILDLHDK